MLEPHQQIIMNNSLLNGIINNALHEVVMALHFGANANDFQVNTNIPVNMDEKTPLHLAVTKGSGEIVEALLEAGANRDTLITENQDSPFHLAARIGRIDIVKAFLEYEAKLCDADSNRDPLLYIDAANSLGATPLYIAAEKGHTEIVELLLENEANINTDLTKYGATPLFIAALNGQLEILKLLLRAKANFDAALTADGATPLFIAAQEGHTQIVNALLKEGANFDAALTTNGTTPLFIAAQNGHNEIVKTLITHRANFDAARKDGPTPLYIAAQEGHTEIVKTLITHRANFDADITTKGATPLFIAAQKGHTEIVECLVKSGARINKTDHMGFNPLNNPQTNFETIFTKALSNVQGGLDLQNIAFSDNLFNILLEIIKSSKTITGIDISNITITGQGVLNEPQKNQLEQAIDENDNILYVVDNGLNLNLNRSLQERQDKMLQELDLKNVVLNNEKKGTILDLSSQLKDYLKKEFIDKKWIQTIIQKYSSEEIHTLVSNILEKASISKKEVIIEHIKYENYPVALEELKKAEKDSLKINYSKLLEVFLLMPYPESSQDSYNILLENLLCNIDKKDLASNLDYYKNISPLSIKQIKEKLGDMKFTEEVQNYIDKLQRFFNTNLKSEDPTAEHKREADDGEGKPAKRKPADDHEPEEEASGSKRKAVDGEGNPAKRKPADDHEPEEEEEEASGSKREADDGEGNPAKRKADDGEGNPAKRKAVDDELNLLNTSDQEYNTGNEVEAAGADSEWNNDL